MCGLTQKSLIFFSVIITVFTLFFEYDGLASAPQVIVKSKKEVTGQSYIYHFRLTNLSQYPVSKFSIGFDSKTFENLLVVDPVGFELASERNEKSVIPSSSSTSPSGWEIGATTQEESDKISITWQTSNKNQLLAIAPGASLDGFSVTLPKEDSNYSNTKAEIYFTRGSASVSISVEPEADSTPELSVSLSPKLIWPPDNKMIEVTSTISVNQNSSVKLVSITCNDECNPSKDIADAKYGTDDRKFSVRASRSGSSKSGREYVVTYSATNAAGKKTTQTQKILVPHEQTK